MPDDVSERDVFQPDVSAVRCVRFPSPTQVLRGAPEVAIKAKINAHLQNVARSVWIVYPDDRSLVVHFADQVREFKGDHAIGDPMLPSFTTPVSDFFV